MTEQRIHKKNEKGKINWVIKEKESNRGRRRAVTTNRWQNNNQKYVRVFNNLELRSKAETEAGLGRLRLINLEKINTSAIYVTLSKATGIFISYPKW